MDNIKRVIPLRKYALQQPLVVAFNIHLTHHNAFGNKHYHRVLESLTSTRGANLGKDKVYLLPNVTNL